MDLLEHSLRRVEAPAELWDRVMAPAPKRRRRVVRWVVVAAACASVAMAGILYRPALSSDDPAAVRAWVRARSGMDVPLAAQHAVLLTGARVVKGRVEIGYRSGVVLVSKADGRAAHWADYAIECQAPACVLCHS